MRLNNTVDKRDFVIGSIITMVMATLFSLIGGLPLIVTFVPGLFFSWITFLYLFKNKIEIPGLEKFLPVFVLLLAWQFIHFNEEFITGFYKQFPELYGTKAYSKEKFVSINMISYALFVLASVLVLKYKRNFLLIPVLFFIIYGAIGNAIAHSWWSFSLQRYFPGLYTAQFYWLLGPWVLLKLIGSKRIVSTIILLFGVILIFLITYFKA